MITWESTEDEEVANGGGSLLALVVDCVAATIYNTSPGGM